MALWATSGVGLAADLNLQPFTGFTFNNPIGVDFMDTGPGAGQLLMSVNYPNIPPFPTGLHNFDLVAPGGAPTQFSTLAGLTEELKVATVRTTSCQGGFAAGDAFTGNGVIGEIVRMDATGAIYPPAANNPGSVANKSWVKLPGETALLRGSFFQDRFCTAGGDLIVATANEQTGDPANDNIGNLWRVKPDGTATLVANLFRHLEGVTTVPNDALLYGPVAGRIIAGDEDRVGTSGNGPTGKIWACNPNAVNDCFSIGAAAGGQPACTVTAGLATPIGCNFATLTTIHPEDLDIIRLNSDFFGIDFGAGQVLTAKHDDLIASNFRDRCGQILVTAEFPDTSASSGLYALRWDPLTIPPSFVADQLTLDAGSEAVGHWEHVTFTSGQDCFSLKVEKTPKSGTFTSGGQATYTIVVTNTGALASHIKLTDALPGNGGLVWEHAVPTAGSCVDPIVGNALDCDFGTVAAGASVTVTVTSTLTTPAAACQDQPNPAAIATDDHGDTAQDNGDLTCTPPPQLKVVKSPKAGTFNQGDQVSFTIVVSNPAPAGSQSATNVQLVDQLPGNGGLQWTSGSVTQGSCTLAANLLSCSLGTIAPGGSVTITVNSTATTPPEACQDQPNDGTLGVTNLATATADGGLKATDIGKLTCKPPGGLIAPTETTCQQFVAGTASALGQINYSLTGANKIAQGINPGVFFYYTSITTTVVNQVVTVTETQNDLAALFQIQKDQDRLYTANCSSFTTGTLNAGATGASYTIATPGTYIISVKYSTKSIAGTSAPSIDPVTYTFTTSLGATTSATVLLKKQ